jgi:hypothetical protein
MQTSPTDFLRALGHNKLSSGAAVQSGSNGLDFAQLLSQARAGQIQSNIPVRAAQGSGVELSESQLARLGKAADLAEANGATRAAFIIDGKVVSMDVPTRTITGSIDATTTKVIDGIDAVVSVAEPGSRGPAATISPPLNPTTNLSLLNALSQYEP